MEFRVRGARVEDYPDFQRMFVLLGVDDPVPDVRKWEEVFCPGTVVAEGTDGFVGAYMYVQRLKGTAYVRNLVVDPAWQGRQVGRRLLLGLAAELQKEGIFHWQLNVKPENVPAVRLYRRVGMERAWRSATFRGGWGWVDGLGGEGGGDRGVRGVVIGAEEDGWWERAFDLPGGQIDQARSRSRRHPLGLLEEESPVGLAIFDPGFPGAFPFRVRRVSLVRPLLELMRPFARPEHDHVHVTVEDDAALQQFLVEQGATMKMEIDHYMGTIP